MVVVVFLHNTTKANTTQEKKKKEKNKNKTYVIFTRILKLQINDSFFQMQSMALLL